jgi:hypothetical protein
MSQAAATGGTAHELAAARAALPALLQRGTAERIMYAVQRLPHEVNCDKPEYAEIDHELPVVSGGAGSGRVQWEIVTFVSI